MLFNSKRKVIRMKKILFIGKFNLIFQDINNYFDSLFNVQVCVDNLDMVKGILKLKQPDIAVISLIGVSSDMKKILADFKFNHPRIPVLCIGTEGEIGICKKDINTYQFTFLSI